MHKNILVMITIIGLALLGACGNDEQDDLDGLVPLEVEFEVPETADVGETVELKAIVTYGDEIVDDADDMNFEYWKGDDRENSITVDSTNNGDGTYTAEVSFDEDGVYSMYAHTTARELHTMPKKSIIVGDVEQSEEDNIEDDENGDEG